MSRSDNRSSKRQDGREWHGQYRAKVTEVDIDNNDYGAIRVFIPALMFANKIKNMHKEFDENQWGLIAYPANNPMGGYNTKDQDQSSFYQSSMMVPLLNSWVWVFFEGGDPNRPFYTGAFQYKNSKVPPENRNLDTPHKCYTLCKTHTGRSIILCDSEDQERVEICGKKRFIGMNTGSDGSPMGGDPAGDEYSPYQINSHTGTIEPAELEGIDTVVANSLPPEAQTQAAQTTASRTNSDGNQTSILIDERDGKSKILIQTHKGDFIHLDVDDRELHIFTKSDMMFETEGDFNLKVGGNMNVNVQGDLSEEIAGNKSVKAGGDNTQSSGGIFSTKSGNVTTIDGAMVHIQEGKSQECLPVFPRLPFGAREL